MVEGVLADRRMLLIWDNFETVRSMPDPYGATAPLDEAGCQQLRSFLHKLAARGRSAVLITSRTPEDWLGEIRRYHRSGRAWRRRRRPSTPGTCWRRTQRRRPRRARRAFGELMAWLDGHPLSMRLILPSWTRPSQRHCWQASGERRRCPAGRRPGRPATSLPASVSYSYDHLGATTRRLLPAVCLFHAVADADVLAAFSQVPGVPSGSSGMTGRIGSRPSMTPPGLGCSPGWAGGMYRIHPALPGYLAAGWRREDPENYDAVRDRRHPGSARRPCRPGRWLFSRSVR